MDIGFFINTVCLKGKKMRVFNSSLHINPVFFGKNVEFYNGVSILNRNLFFIHNSSRLSNLFLSKKIKPRPVLKKK